MSDIEATVRSIFNSYAYNRAFSYMVDLCEEVLERMQGHFTSSNCTYDGDILDFRLIPYVEYEKEKKAENIEEVSEDV